jgi:two-component system CheB/CheR fusion protein
VDVVLPAALLAQKLADFGKHQPMLPHDPGQLTEVESETLQRILAQVHARTGNDFSQYKRSTILRRIERRMQLNNFTTLDAYLAFLRGNSTEAHAMFNDILIGVTNFFRDHDSWESLQEQVIPALFQPKKSGESDGIRVWSIGCATGEEAYGLAMLLFEEAARQEIHTVIQVFASDLDDRSISRAREGLYPAAIQADVTPERLTPATDRLPQCIDLPGALHPGPLVRYLPLLTDRGRISLPGQLGVCRTFARPIQRDQQESSHLSGKTLDR